MFFSFLSYNFLENNFVNINYGIVKVINSQNTVMGILTKLYVLTKYKYWIKCILLEEETNGLLQLIEHHINWP